MTQRYKHGFHKELSIFTNGVLFQYHCRKKRGGISQKFLLYINKLMWVDYTNHKQNAEGEFYIKKFQTIEFCHFNYGNDINQYAKNNLHV